MTGDHLGRSSVPQPGEPKPDPDAIQPVTGLDLDLDLDLLMNTLASAGQSVATAESLTGGLLATVLTEIAGSSRVFRGGIVAYHVDLKTDLLGVGADLLRTGGAVQPEVADQMARGVRARLDATWGLSTTGVAGPDPSDGAAVGTVFIAIAGPAGACTQALQLTGDRGAIRHQTVRACVRLLTDAAGRSGSTAIPWTNPVV